MNMKLKKLLNDIQKTEDKIAELQEHLKRQNTLRQQMEDIEIVKSFRSMKLDSRSLLVLLDGIQKGTVTIQMDEDGGITVEDAKAPQKKAKQIFAPMRQITNSLIERNALVGPGTMFKGQQLNTAENYLGDPAGSSAETAEPSGVKVLGSSGTGKVSPGSRMSISEAVDVPAAGNAAVEPWRCGRSDKSFAPAGQTTQMIIGAGGETDQSILTTSENLYRTFKMKRVYYSAYIPVMDSPILPDRNTAPPLAREHRIYQADWLLRFYGFKVSELFNEENANLDPDLDPKVTWALRNLEEFPVEINRASYEMLMRIPGIGAVSARRIIRQRKLAPVKFEDLKKMGVVMKRAKYFLTCSGRYYGERRFEQETIRNSILQMENGLQLSMFDNSWNRLEEGARQEKLSSAGVI